MAGYKDFVAQATVHEYKESDAEINLWENSAVASCLWEIVYDMKGQSYRETGRDLFVFACARGRWQAVWRTILMTRQSGH